MRAGGRFAQSVTGYSVKISPHCVAYVEGLSLVGSLSWRAKRATQCQLIVVSEDFFCFCIRVDMLSSSHKGHFSQHVWECVLLVAMHNSVRVSFFLKLQIYLVFSIGKWIISQIFTRYQANDYKLVEEFSQIFTEMGFSMLEAFKWSM